MPTLGCSDPLSFAFWMQGSNDLEVKDAANAKRIFQGMQARRGISPRASVGMLDKEDMVDTVVVLSFRNNNEVPRPSG